MDIPEMFTMKDGKLEKVDTSLRRMCEIAKERLDTPKTLLTLLYVNNLATPESLREIIKGFVNGKYNKEEAIKKLDALR